MKTAKKLFSLLLVAVLLFSAVPFQASATELPKKIFFYSEPGNMIGTAELPVGTKYLTVAQIPTIAPTATQKHVGWQINGSETKSIQSVDMSVNYTWNTSIAGDFQYVDAFATYETIIPPHVHEFTVVSATVAPTCTEGGYTRYTCGAAGCDNPGAYQDRDLLPKIGHDYKATTVGNQTEYVCSVCQDKYTEKNADAVSFVNNHTTGNDSQMMYKDGEMITSVPTAAKIYGKKFLGWFANDGRQLIANQTIWDDDFAKTYYANYISSTEDGLSRITVKCIYYIGTEAVATRDLYVVDLEDGTNIQTWLSNNYSKTNLAIQNNRPDSAQYNWEVIGKYYKLVNNTPVTASDLIANSDMTIAVKAYADKSDIRNVYLYIHNKAGQREVDIIQMTGFSVGSQVTVTNAQNAYKNKYNKVPTFANGVLYDEMAWSQLSQNQPSAGSLSYTVSPDGLIVHAIVTGHTSAGTSKPASNPTTGDMIETTAIVMVLAAAAVVTLTQLRKRKMI